MSSSILLTNITPFFAAQYTLCVTLFLPPSSALLCRGGGTLDLDRDVAELATLLAGLAPPARGENGSTGMTV